MRRGLRTGLIAAAVLPIAALAVPFVVPADVYKEQIERGVTGATGRAFAIAGPLHFTLFPLPGIRADKVALANVAGGRAPALLRADDVRLGVQLWPLLSGRVEMSQIVLDRPQIALEVDAQGHANWTFARKTGGGGASLRLPLKAHFSGLSIAHGRVAYFNARTGGTHVLDDLGATIALNDLDRPAAVDGSFILSGQRVGFTAKIATPQSLLKDTTTALDLSLTADLLQARFTGSVAQDGNALGHMKIDTPSLRGVGAWLGLRLPAGGGLGAMSLKSQFAGDTKVASLSDLKLSLDGMNIAGNLRLDRAADIPSFAGALTIDRLDLNPYTELPKGHGRPGASRSTGWSDDPIALDVLRKVDADLTLDVGRLQLRKLTLGHTHIKVALSAGKLTALMDPMALYGGAGRARLDVDDAGVVPQFHNVLEFDNVALKPFFADTIGVGQIEGTGTIKLDVAARGMNADAIMHDLGGKGSIAFHDGRLRGVDLGAVARTIQAVLGAAIGQGAFTSYSRMGGSFSLNHGLLSNTDFQLNGPLLSTTGSGIVDVANRSIDFKIMPKASATLANQKLLTVGVPFRIKGPWKHVHYTPDLVGFVGSVLENLEVGKAPFKGLVSVTKTGTPSGPPKKHKSVGQALKNMFGIH